MLNYLFRRILLVIPTLLVISFLAFGLNQCTPGDPIVQKMPDIRIRSQAEAAIEYKKVYRRTEKDLGIDQPVFYLSISSQAYPDTINQIVPLSERENLLRMIGLYGNWPVIQEYYRLLQATTQQVLVLNDEYTSDVNIEVRKKIQQLSIRSEAKEIKSILNNIEEQTQKDSLLNTTLKTNIVQLKQLHDDLIASESHYDKYIPKLRWNGTSNQYHAWLGKILQGDFGESSTTGQKVSERVFNALRWTIQLNGIGILLVFIISIPLGVYVAIWAGSTFDRWLNIILVLLFAMPSFWVATMLSKFLTVPEWINLFPVMGVGDVPADASWFEKMSIRSHHLFLPIFCITYGSLAYVTRQVRSSMLRVLSSDYIRTARAKGLPERTVIWKHAFRNAMFPIITMFASILPSLVGGAIIVEIIFGIPGVGWLTINSIYTKDWPIVYALLLLTAIMTIAGILLSDLLYAWADPRVKLASKNGSNG